MNNCKSLVDWQTNAVSLADSPIHKRRPGRPPGSRKKDEAEIKPIAMPSVSDTYMGKRTFSLFGEIFFSINGEMMVKNMQAEI